MPRIVLVHDAARPFVSPALITRAISRGEDRRRDSRAGSGRHRQDRRSRAAPLPAHSTGPSCALVQTPQAFAFRPIWMRTGAPQRRAATISPTMPPLPNGPGSMSPPSRGKPPT